MKTNILEQIRINNPTIPCLFEYYTYILKDSKEPLSYITNTLLTKPDYIVKILGHNLHRETDSVVDFKLEKYDQIFLIERYDYFTRCCSLQVSSDTGVWLLFASQPGVAKSYEDIKTKKFIVTNSVLMHVARDTAYYLNIKKYLIDNDIAFHLTTYDDTIESPKGSSLTDPKLDYKAMINNHDLKDQVNNMFNKFFDYTTCFSDINEFAKESNILVPTLGYAPSPIALQAIASTKLA